MTTRHKQPLVLSALLASTLAMASGCGPEPTIEGDTATVKIEFDVNTAQLFSVAHDLGTATYRAAVKHPQVK